MLTENRNKCLLQNPDFKYDEACVDVYNFLEQQVVIYGQYEECDKCDFQNLTTLEPKANSSLLVSTKYLLRMHYQSNTSCSLDDDLLEHYRFGWNISNQCTPIYIKDPASSAYLPIVTAIIILFFFGTLWYLVKGIYKCLKNNERFRRYIYWTVELHNDLGGPSESTLIIERPPPIRKHPHRIKSIDVFRGFSIILMIFVNYGGGKYEFFQHSVWNGLTFADLVFPWFVWIMGVSFSISLRNKLRKAVPRRQIFMEVVRRSFILILLGLCLNSHGRKTPLEVVRFPGVLQRLGITYLIIGIIETSFAKRTMEEYGRLSCAQDILIAWPQWLMITILVTVHTCVTFLLKVPGCEEGYLGPGGLHDGGKHFNCTGGAAGSIDRAIFGDHMYRFPSCRVLYETKVYYDPEGLLGTLTCVFLAYLGVQAGRTLYAFTDVRSKVSRWCAWGISLTLIGGALCTFSKNSGPIPLNKNLWSLSFVMVLGGLAFLVETVLFVLVDIMRKWGGRPFFYPGMNAITLYVGHELLRNTFPFAWNPVYQSHAEYLGMNLWGTALWVAISIFLYKKNLFLSI